MWDKCSKSSYVAPEILEVLTFAKWKETEKYSDGWKSASINASGFGKLGQWF
jgi:hypothetical protein